MDFRTEINIPPSDHRISYRSGILFTGSCFAESIGALMKELGFRVDLNAFGVNYNPSSVARNLWTLLNRKNYTGSALEFNGEKWFSFDHHSEFSNPDKKACLEKINQRLRMARQHLENTGFLLITWGTAWVYVHRKTKNVVCNCHKLPAAEFSRYLLTVSQITDTYTKLFAALRQALPGLRIILTVSPVRHLKDGHQLNAVSKASLILAAHALTEMFSYCDYFPAWEIAMDDLRDYRFYADDLVHPDQQMIRYIWEKFSETWLDEESRKILPEIRKLADARNHRPFDPSSEKHREFCRKQLEKIRDLRRRNPDIQLSELEDYFQSFL